MLETLKEIWNASTVLAIKKDPANEYIHPTQKPVALPEMCIRNSSYPEDIVFGPIVTGKQESYRPAVNGVATYGTIRLFNTGHPILATLFMLLFSLGPIGMLFLLLFCVAKIAISLI